MLSNFAIEKFKAFEHRAEMEIAPITILMGENSSGKSSLIHGMLLLSQSLSLPKFRSPRLRFNGGRIALGGFTSATFGHVKKNKIRFEFGVAPDLSRYREAGSPFSGEAFSVKLEYGLDDKGEATLTSATISFENVQVAKFKNKSGKMEIHDSGQESAIGLWAAWIGAADKDGGLEKTLDSETVKWLSDRLRKLPVSQNTLLPTWDHDEIFAAKVGRPVGGSLLSGKRLWLSGFVNMWADWMRGLEYRIARSFNFISHVGPLRKVPSRWMVDDQLVEARGLDSDGKGVVGLLMRNKLLRDEVNRELESLGMNYSIEPARLTVGDENENFGELSAIYLRDLDSATSVTFSDVGIGISQALPIVVNSLTNRDTVNLIEQPELHIHPSQQGNLSDIIIKSFKKRRNRFVIETHSEHMLRRILRRIRENQISSDEVRLYYVSRKSGASATLLNLPIRDDGTLETGFPSGFFAEEFDDLFS